jgi:hypothetical protein
LDRQRRYDGIPFKIRKAVAADPDDDPDDPRRVDRTDSCRRFRRGANRRTAYQVSTTSTPTDRRTNPANRTNKQLTREALNRRNPSAELQTILDTLHDRLSKQGNGFDCRKALSFVDNYARHLDVRANLPQRRLNRVPAVLRELLSWRYHEYANGFKSAAKDLVSQ